jgi:tetratricopeptide (TPR) repeat protein
MRSIVLLALFAAPVVSAGQEPPSLQTLFEAGAFEQVVNADPAVMPVGSPDAIYLRAQSLVRLNRQDDARAEFGKLAAGATEPTPWSLVAESAVATLDANPALAVEKGTQGVALAPESFHPRYQLGLAYSAAEQWAPAAEAFEKATALNPTFAYAHYYAGLAFSRTKQLDKMANHLDYFLKLAPNAPERPAVMSMMRALRGL